MRVNQPDPKNNPAQAVQVGRQVQAPEGQYAEYVKHIPQQRDQHADQQGQRLADIPAGGASHQPHQLPNRYHEQAVGIYRMNPEPGAMLGAKNWKCAVGIQVKTPGEKVMPRIGPHHQDSQQRNDQQKRSQAGKPPSGTGKYHHRGQPGYR